VQTSRWPKHPVAIKGRRIGVIGTGASGVQVIPPLAEEAKHLTVFQRSPNYVVPPQNRPLDPRRYSPSESAFDQKFQQFPIELLGVGRGADDGDGRGFRNEFR